MRELKFIHISNPKDLKSSRLHPGQVGLAAEGQRHLSGCVAHLSRPHFPSRAAADLSVRAPPPVARLHIARALLSDYLPSRGVSMTFSRSTLSIRCAGEYAFAIHILIERC
jgi:hypothetical protein